MPRVFPLKINLVYFVFITLFCCTSVMAQFENSWAVIVSDTVQVQAFSAEQKLQSRLLDTLGFEVADIIQVPAISDGIASSYDLVIIGASVNSGQTATALPSLAAYEIPIINFEPFLFDHLNMQDNGSEGSEYAGTSISIINSDHYLAAGLSDTVLISEASSVQIGYDLNPQGDFQVIAVAVDPASSPNDVNYITLFAYETGADMFSGTAPARRVGGFFLNNVADSMSAEGWELFDASVIWAMGQENYVNAIDKMEQEAPDMFVLHNNYPNPFNPRTQIRYSLSSPTYVEISIWNALGERIINLVQENKAAGEHISIFNATDLSSGIYYALMKAAETVQIQKMILVK